MSVSDNTVHISEPMAVTETVIDNTASEEMPQVQRVSQRMTARHLGKLVTARRKQADNKQIKRRKNKLSGKDRQLKKVMNTRRLYQR